MLAKPSFSMPCIIIFFVGFAIYAGGTLLPMLVQTDFGYSATKQRKRLEIFQPFSLFCFSVF